MSREDIPAEIVSLGRSANVGFWVASAVGVVGLAAGWLLAGSTEDGTRRFLYAYLVNYAFFLSLALGALFFVMVTHITRAGWSIALRRLAEAICGTLLPLAILIVPVYLGRHDLYEWTHASEVAKDKLLQHKSGYLNESFFMIRIIVYFVIWLVLSRYFMRRSVQQDRSGDPALTLEMEKVSAPGLIAFALTLTFAAFDLLMSLTPHWYSTIFGVYYFSGAAVGFFALMSVLVFLLHRAGRLRQVVNLAHYHDLGKLAFAFVVFWAYIAFSQYMLIWYGNLPEETIWYLRRQEGEWAWISLLLLFGHFVVPFLALMSKHPKRAPAALVVAAVWILVMHWLDVYWVVMPGISPGRVPLHLLDLACLLGIGGIFTAALLFRMKKHPLIPVKDPRLGESLEFENA